MGKRGYCGHIGFRPPDVKTSGYRETKPTEGAKEFTDANSAPLVRLAL